MNSNYFYLIALLNLSFLIGMESTPASSISQTALAASTAAPYAIGVGSISAGVFLARAFEKNQKAIKQGFDNTLNFLGTIVEKNFPTLVKQIKPYNTPRNHFAIMITPVTGAYLAATIMGMTSIAHKHFPCDALNLGILSVAGLGTGALAYAQYGIWEGKKN